MPGVRLPGPSVSNAAAAARPGLLRPIRPSNTMKHEWFEKTVRAAARVNSNLSYTLTQLNRAQANATSVEGLAVVHNKLQEILSSSINSLIQIRKNLRTEFIAGNFERLIFKIDIYEGGFKSTSLIIVTIFH